MNTEPTTPAPKVGSSALFGIDDVTDQILEDIESDIGMGCGAWDCVNPKEIIAAAWNRMPNESSSATRRTGGDKC